MGNKISLKKNSVVYILAPANTFTGGPELLHQFAYHFFKLFKVKTKMVYLPMDQKNLVHKNFKKYKVAYSSSIIDHEDNILIIPEANMYLEFSMKFKKLKKILWWMSLDNYFGYKFKYEYNKYLRSLIKIPYKLINIFNKIVNYNFGIYTEHDYLKFFYSFKSINTQKELTQISLHMAQSYYSLNFLKKKFKNVKYLSDYQRDEIIKINKTKNKKNIICYSGKSNKFIDKIIEYTNLPMLKLSGIKSNNVIKILKSSKLFIDFGYHPGKDRLPREAVVLNNCIITNKKGSASNSIDIPIKKKYKFLETNNNLPKIEKTINKIIIEYHKEIKHFKNYKKLVLKEKKKFLVDLKKIFVKKFN